MNEHLESVLEYVYHGQVGSFLDIHIIVEQQIAQVVDHFEYDFIVSFAIDLVQ